MEIVKNIIIAIYLIVCVALIFLITKQSKEDSGASGTVMGASASNFYEKNKGKTKEGKIKRATIILAVVFVILNVALGIIYVV
ncbi:MAG: preprotein translocase subunit SecG [Clostridia bacterium]|nr:preprotein translocase subunit SecG [Clostridia bacterium]